ncbi:MAG: O-antigen ligase family protein [Candidatus Firestonebacteria bacterium]
MNQKNLFGKLSKSIVLILTLLTVLSEYLLVLTYSRGGYIAFVFTALMFLLAVKNGKAKKQLVLFLSVFIVLLILTPKGISRVGSIIASDDAIGNRLILWKSATEITFDHWLFGTGFHYFGDTFVGWYQPLDMFIDYASAVNTPLTIGAGGGIFLLFIYLMISFTAILGPIMENVKKENGIILGVAFSQLSYFIAGISSTFIHSFWLNISIVILLIISFAYLIKCWFKRKDRLKDILLTLRTPFLISLIICLALIVLGSYFNSEASTHHKILKKIGKNKITVYILTPAKAKKKAIILYTFNNKSTCIGREARRTLRYLAEKGYIVFTPELTDMDLHGLADLKEVVNFVLEQKAYSDFSVIQMGQSEGGQYTIIAASEISNPRLKAVVSIGAPAKWPFKEMSPERYIANVKVPIFLLHGSEDLVYEVENAYILEKSCKNAKSKLLVVKGVANYLEPKRNEAIDEIDKFINKVLKNEKK